MTTRRSFIKVMGASAGALVLGVRLGEAQSDVVAHFEPNAWLRIEPDGSVLIRIGKSEMGQGVRTSLPMIVAEELDADFDSIRIEQASPGPDFRRLGTGGSGSIMRLWDPLRQAGAAARSMLLAAAADRWSVPVETLETRKGSVYEKGTARRLSYGELAVAAARQPVPERPSPKPRAEYQLVGTGQRRIDVRDIVTGKAKYGLDVRVPGMRFAVVARPPVLGSSVVSFDGAASLKIPGVRNVIEIPTGVAVVADNTWAAMRGRDALKVEWSESPHKAFNSEQHMRALIEATSKPALTIRKDAEGRAAFANVAQTIEATYTYPFAAHASVEPVNCTVLVEEGKATLWSPTQTPNGVHDVAAHLLGLPEESITVHVMLLGGGFGRRLGFDFDREAIEIAKQLRGTPVQLVWSREDDMKHGYFQAASAHRLFAGLDPEGRVVAWEHRKASTPHNARSVPTEDDKVNPETVRGWAWGVYDMPYFIAAAEMSYAVMDSPVPIGPWRAVFSPSSVFARECFIDEVAQHTGRDPLALRLTLLGADDESVEKVVTIAGEVIDRTRLRRVLEVAAEKSGWNRPVAKGRARGLACNVFHTGTAIAYVAEVSLRNHVAEGELPFVVHRVVCAIDCGLTINPLGTAQQVESGVLWSLSNMKGEITVKDGAIEQSYYSDFRVAMIGDTPASIETHFVEGGEQPLGVGEPTVCPFAPAVANAISRLRGERVRSLPVRGNVEV